MEVYVAEYYSKWRLHQLSSTSIFVKLSLCARFIFGKTIESLVRSGGAWFICATVSY